MSSFKGNTQVEALVPKAIRQVERLFTRYRVFQSKPETRNEERESKVTGENRNENRTGDRGESSFGVEIDSSGMD